MIILTVRTDKPEAELGLYDDDQQLAYEMWQAHRALAETIHQKIDEILVNNNKTIENIDAILIYKGPGSFTGLRIGMSVANALAYSLQIPIKAASDNWLDVGINQILDGKYDAVALPDYGGAVFTTKPKK